jgi:hypothetical protein
MPWTFYDYVTGSGRNAIRDWVAGQPQGTRQRLKARLAALINELRLVDKLERANGVGQLRGDCSGLYELIVFVDKIQFRPIGCYGPGQTGEFTLLIGAVEKGGKFTDQDVCRRAHERAARIRDKRHVCIHTFD